MKRIFDNRDLYPTPEAVIEKMVGFESLSGATVLEPSAGLGNIVDYCLSNGANVIACEVVPELRNILSKKCKLIAEDFLEVTPEMISHIDYIIMNPPFSADEKHILHAFEIAPPQCKIIALCNWETLKNAYSKDRKKLLTLIENYGISENLGAVFSDAERRTNVEVGLIKLTKYGQKSDEWEGFFMDEEEEEQFNGLQQYNFVRDVVNRYVGAVKIFDEQLESAKRMNALTGTFFKSKIALSMTEDDAVKTREEYKKDLQRSAWHWVIGKFNLNKHATQGLREDINNFVEKQSHIPFTMKNIYQMITIIIGTTGSRMDRALEDVFEKFTKYSHENRWGNEGWKTNSHYLLKEKFIVPYIAPECRYFKNKPDVNLRSAEDLDDLTKALCYLLGENYDKDEYCRFSIVASRASFGEWFDWGFFEVKLFKKGTGHFKFKYRDVWATFNQNIARIKGYPLPDKFKKNKTNN